MKAQIAIEYMLIYIVVLSAILILLSSSYKMFDSVKYFISAQSFKKDSQQLSDSINEVCNLGPYNSRSIKINTIIEIVQSESNLEFKSGNLTYKSEFNCDKIESSDEIKGEVIIKRSDTQNPGGISERIIEIKKK